MRDVVVVFKALGDRSRLRILKMLEQKCCCVCELTHVLGLAQPSVSRHLKILKDAGLVRDVRNGQWIDYELSREKLNVYAPHLLGDVGEWLNEDSVILGDSKKIRKANRDEICKR